MARYPSPASETLNAVAAALPRALGTSLLSLSVHGSYTAGDFQPGRSDLDLLALLARDPDEAALSRLRVVHEELAPNNSDWSGQIEVDYVSPGAIHDVLAGGPAHPMVRISPGEPMHLGRVDSAICSTGTRPSRATAWVAEAHAPGARAYAALTVCWAAATLDAGRQLSKRAAGTYGIGRLPQWAPLIEWSRDWCYGGGDDRDPDPGPAVVSFVREVSTAVLAAYGSSGQGDR